MTEYQRNALCNVISAWEAARIAGRNVDKDFPTFYKEQVLAGNIKKDTYGKDTVGVFFNADKPYLEPTTLIGGDKRDLYSDAGKTEALNILQTTDARVAQVYLDYPGGKKGEHFVIAYRNSQGEWIIKDHNERGAPNWKNGGLLSRAVLDGKIADIRLLK